MSAVADFVLGEEYSSGRDEKAKQQVPPAPSPSCWRYGCLTAWRHYQLGRWAMILDIFNQSTANHNLHVLGVPHQSALRRGPETCLRDQLDMVLESPMITLSRWEIEPHVQVLLLQSSALQHTTRQTLRIRVFPGCWNAAI